jgi:16S rRNA (adenine1518-N6/adenine1519-N6)-dimethyltransferase
MAQINAKKSLGQNFLHNNAIVEKIAQAGLSHQPQTILEIGPGMGVLTRVLTEKTPDSSRVFAVEKDDRLIPILNETFAQEIKSGKLTLIHKDILDLSLSEIGVGTLPTQTSDYAVIANIPYYITGEILKKFLEIEPKPKALILLVQKEVADRIMAREKHTILSTITHILAKPKVIAVVGRHNFSPQPNVDSAILELVPHINSELNTFSTQEFKKLTEFIKISFHSRRKTLIANLRGHYDISEAQKALSELNLPLDIRAEDIEPTIWFLLHKKIPTALAEATQQK